MRRVALYGLNHIVIPFQYKSLSYGFTEAFQQHKPSAPSEGGGYAVHTQRLPSDKLFTATPPKSDGRSSRQTGTVQEQHGRSLTNKSV